MGTYARMFDVPSEPARSFICCVRRSLVVSYTTPLPNTGVMKPYTFACDRSSSEARKKASCASGPMRKVRH